MDFFLLVSRQKWAIAVITIFCTVACFAFSYAMPQSFLSSAMLLPPDRVSSSSLLSKYTAGYALEMLKEVENPSVDLLQNILESRALAERLSMDSSIHAFFVGQGYRGDALTKAIKSSVVVAPSFTKMDVQVTLNTRWFPTANEKQTASTLCAYMANLAVNCMDSMLRAETRELAHDTRLYADSDYAFKKRQLDSVDVRQEAFEQEHGIVILSKQTQTEIERLAKLTSERDQSEIRLRLLSLDLANQAPSREEALAEFQEAEHSTASFGLESQVGPIFDSLPVVSREYAEILRNKAELEPIVNFLRVEAEQERIYEEREKALITLLDPARPPDARFSPIRSQMAFIGLIAGLAISILYIGLRALREAWREDENIRRRTTDLNLDSAFRIFGRPR